MLLLKMVEKIAFAILIYGCLTLCDGTNIFVTTTDGVQDDLDITQFVPFPTNNKYLKFQLKACMDGVVLLYSRSNKRPYYDIIIGGWLGYRSRIRRLHSVDEDVDQFEGYGQVNCSIYKEFWISWNHGIIQGGRGNVLGANVFLSYDEPCPFDINRITIGATQGATVYWILYPISDGVTSQLGSIFTEHSECPTFQTLTTIPAQNNNECAFNCLNEENCKGFLFDENTGSCQMVSSYAISIDLATYYLR